MSDEAQQVVSLGSILITLIAVACFSGFQCTRLELVADYNRQRAIVECIKTGALPAECQQSIK